ncbi:MAG: hypothetical protein U0L45_00510, partial [Alistipes sp.]|nr:hypothetical protein [Alistipes sp.]
WAVRQVQPIAVFIGRALYLPRSDNKIGAKCEHSAVGKLPERWLIFDDPSLLRLGNISRSASTPKAEIENL